MFLVAVNPILYYCITETTLQRLMILRDWQRMLPNICNYSKDEAESSFIIEKIVGKLLSRKLDIFHFIYSLQVSNG
jgi:hypothetical protein